MSLHDMSVMARRQWRHHRLVQIAMLMLAWGLGEALVRLSGLPLPGGIVGMALLLLALTTGWIQLGSLRQGARWFLAEMLLFFVPAVPAVLDHPELFGWLGMKILAVIILGTMTVMAVTSVVVDITLRLAHRHTAA
ncbi:CidA/LrgA family protein [Ideonella sp. B7]|uniref:CidA/LrgA family protein n=1 Tax=Ideonella benzenivorans TaxID=2831643 RepID=UPI001CECFF8F|nr:CidA/LrgA family protein [Ideonella benzenivorans]MCA6217480.1 CidA/LrgA family protein [Ideonella benzenivorans]